DTVLPRERRHRLPSLKSQQEAHLELSAKETRRRFRHFASSEAMSPIYPCLSFWVHSKSENRDFCWRRRSSNRSISISRPTGRAKNLRGCFPPVGGMTNGYRPWSGDWAMQFDINLERQEVYECGALFLTVLACPKEVTTERSLQLYQSLCGHALWLRYLE